MTSIMNSNLLKAAVLCIGVFIGYLIGQGHTAGAPTITDTASVANSAKIPDVKEFSLQIANRKMVAGSGNIEVREGDVVNITIVVSEDEEVHLHGYDKAVDLIKDIPGTLTFIASMTGRFPFELEHSKTELGVVSVEPK